MISFPVGAHRFHLRAAAIVLRDGAVLLHRAEGDPFWTLPGGRIEVGESAEQAVAREMREELAAEIRPARLVWVVENFFLHQSAAHHELGLYFMTEPSRQCVLSTAPGPYEGVEGVRRLEFDWFSPNERSAIGIRPSFLTHLLIKNVGQTRRIICGQAASTRRRSNDTCGKRTTRRISLHMTLSLQRRRCHPGM